MTGEKRRFSRICFDGEARIEVDGVLYPVDRIVNLSIGGCSLQLDAEFAPGGSCRFLIVLAQDVPAIEILGEIVRVGNGEVSVNFTAIEPENLFHLQNIVRYNAEDPDRIEDEISAHPGLR
jgi:PilZ domain